jgi:hypothetical protein
LLPAQPAKGEGTMGPTLAGHSQPLAWGSDACTGSSSADVAARKATRRRDFEQAASEELAMDRISGVVAHPARPHVGRRQCRGTFQIRRMRNEEQERTPWTVSAKRAGAPWFPNNAAGPRRRLPIPLGSYLAKIPESTRARSRTAVSSGVPSATVHVRRQCRIRVLPIEADREHACKARGLIGSLHESAGRAP